MAEKRLTTQGKICRILDLARRWPWWLVRGDEGPRLQFGPRVIYFWFFIISDAA